jgi:threonylcarbamoyladenosine tRNA methylthiotransferase MtaB
MDTRVEVVSFGCRLNAAEAAAMRALAEERASRATVIVNTCAVTGAAERDARRAIRRLKRQRPEADIVVTGCAAQRDAAQFAAMPEVARVLGNREKLDPASWSDPDPPRLAVGDIMTPAPLPPLADAPRQERTRAVVDAQQGCDHRCTFCIIPFTRGPSHSQPLGALAQRIERLCAEGVREVVLSGVDLTAWGRDLPGAPTLGRAIRRLLAQVPALARLRLSSIDPAEVDDDLVEAFAEEPRLMPFAHLSLQAADDLVLKRMRRRHTRAGAVAVAARLRRARPDLAFGADLIAGFPTESDQAAARTRAVIDEIGIAFVHVFAFDARPGTPAARMPPVAASLVAERAAALRAQARAALGRHLAAQIAHEVDVLVERDGVSGHAADFTRVRLDAPRERGTIARARVSAAAADHLIARIS